MAASEVAAIEESIKQAKMRLLEQERMLSEQEWRREELRASVSVNKATKEEHAEILQQYNETLQLIEAKQAQLLQQQQMLCNYMMELRVTVERKAKLEMIAAELTAEADALAAKAAENPGDAKLASQLEQLKAELTSVQTQLYGASAAAGEAASTPSTTSTNGY